MYVIQPFMDRYGVVLIVAIGFAEFLGLPMAGGPLLLLVGGIARTSGVVDPFAAILAASLGGLSGELLWFAVARWQGHRLLRFACGLAANPLVCAQEVQGRVGVHGGSVLLLAKFVPGSGAVPAFAAGLSRLRAARFLYLDGLAVLAWASAYVGAGWLLGTQVEDAIEWASVHLVPAAWMALPITAAALAWRVRKGRHHARVHEKEWSGPPAVAESSSLAKPL